MHCESVFTTFVLRWSFLKPSLLLALHETTCKANLVITKCCEQARLARWQQSKYTDYAGTSDYAGTAEWKQLDLQSIQDRDHFGHLSIFNISESPLKNLVQDLKQILWCAILRKHLANISYLAWSSKLHVELICQQFFQFIGTWYWQQLLLKMTVHFFTLFLILLFAFQCNQTGINTKRIFINEFYGVGGKPFIELARKPQSKLSTD